MGSLRHLLVMILMVGCCNFIFAQEDGEEEPYLPGLIAEYTDRSHHSFRRLDEAIAFHWDDGSPDSRIAADNFDVRWHGRIFAQGAGEYRVAVHASGEIEVKLAGKVAIPRQAASGWIFSEPTTLEFDRHELEINFRKTKSPAHISLYWSGPQFQLEPVPPRFLMHDRKESIQNLYERGEILAAALRCAACHREEAVAKPMPAPSLLHLGGNVHESWLSAWLTEKGTEQASNVRRMPAYGLSEDEATAIAAFLKSTAKYAPPADVPSKTPAPKPNLKPSGKPLDTPSAETGQRLFLTLGCIACHEVNGLGESGFFGGGDLSRIATKRPASFFSEWLADPTKLNPDHRMPVFDLTVDERTSLSLYLASLGKPAMSAKDNAPSADLIDAGRKLVSTHRCASCHALPKDPELSSAAPPKSLGAKSNWTKSCAAGLESSKAHLGYSLTAGDQKALQEFFSASRADSKPAVPSGRLGLLQNNCLACHGREGVESLSASLPKKLADKLAALAEIHPDLAASVPAMNPPSLNSIGDKYHEDALAAVIRRQGPPLRDYLLVRMPRFPLPDDELKRLTGYFIQTDRIPPLPDAVATKPTPAEEAAFALAGNRLVSTDGFGCTSCHQVGKVVPDKAPLNARGPSLSSLDKRIRKEWYDRFLRNPARIVPRMEMPSVQIPVRGVLDSKLDPQLAALWYVLATPDFEPPEPNPVRVLRLLGDTDKKEAPVVVTDVVKMGDKTFVRPFLVGLPDRHNILFDLETNRLAAWWVGDAARQRTKGKSWYWEAGGKSLIEFPNEPELSLIYKDKQYSFDLHDGNCDLERWYVRSQYAETIHAIQPHPAGRFDADDQLKKKIWISQRWWPLSKNKQGAGFLREISLGAFPPEATLRLRLIPTELAQKVKIIDGNQIEFPGPSGLQMRVFWPHRARLDSAGVVSLTIQEMPEVGIISGAPNELHIEYRATLADGFAAPAEPAVRNEPEAIEIATGLSGRRIAAPTNLLPTGMSWRPHGEMTICTLRGEVLMIDEAASPSAPKYIRTVTDGLPSPYGLSADNSDDYVDVATKVGIVRLHGDKLTLSTIVTSGWGYTSDYHDWVVGLVRSPRGYYLGLPCQQDDRSAGGAALRGTVIEVMPKELSRLKRNADENAGLAAISTGHRFPMGLAVNRDGDLFVTDNQGNYNPFNELNHVRKGAFFGFVNAIDKKNKDYKVPPLTEPAINIPHPWTRSVNGICFLYTPEKLKKETGKDAFGPLEGQLVGCEYDTRRLIRMSLQKIGETYQGCAYPLSQEPSSPEKGFLGPIVCAVSPRGELYVGSIRESGWGAGNNVGEIVKIKFEPEKLPCGIGEVKAVKGGFSIDFLREVDAKKAAEIANYSISSYRRISTPAYGGPDVDRRIEKINSVELSEDRRRAIVDLPELRTGGFVYEIQLKNLAPGEAEFFPAEAYFTLHGVP